jgi:hypothetical protein
VWAKAPNVAAILQHSCSIYAAANRSISRLSNGSANIYLLFQMLEKYAAGRKDFSMLQPDCSIAAALRFERKT